MAEDGQRGLNFKEIFIKINKPVKSLNNFLNNFFAKIALNIRLFIKFAKINEAVRMCGFNIRLSGMKQQVTWNWLAVILTLGTMLLLVIGMMATRDDPTKYYFLGFLLLGLLAMNWFYSPRAIATEDNSIVVCRRLKRKKLQFSDIKSISYYTPQVFSGLKLCGSGGFGGYWGWYSAADIGTYFAYFGDPNSCFLIELKNGRKYVLGCDNPESIIEEVKKGINNSK